MKRLKIRNLGPLSEVDLDFGKVKVIIGLQSSGKSCVLKTACCCSWIEKRIHLVQSSDEFSKEGRFLNALTVCHKMKDHLWLDSYIEYESSYLKFSYDHSRNTFAFAWKAHKWDFRRPKISYAPSDRNSIIILLCNKAPLCGKDYQERFKPAPDFSEI